MTSSETTRIQAGVKVVDMSPEMTALTKNQIRAGTAVLAHANMSARWYTSYWG